MNYVQWFWDFVFVRVYQSDPVMMALFGWALFLAPVLVVVCGITVLRGAGGAFRPPTAVPPTNLTTSD